jgi:hypothetical protein
MQRELGNSPITERIIRAYRLYTLRHGHFHKHPIILTALGLTEKSKAILQKVAAKLPDPNDPEGYVRAAFELFKYPYPNMLLSSRVAQYYHSHIDSWKAQLNIILIVELNLIRSFQSQNKRDLATLRLLLNDFHPLVQCYALLQVFHSHPDEELRCRAQYEYWLWPTGYNENPAWSQLLSLLSKQNIITTGTVYEQASSDS